MAEHVAHSSAFSAAVLGMNESWPLPAAAKVYARHGVPVFPCAPGEKHPLIRDSRGFHDATTDLDQVQAWWDVTPRANIGIPTGAGSGVVVVDVDVHGAVNGYQAFAGADRAGLVDGWELLARSPSGGMHAYFPASPQRDSEAGQRSWQAVRAGIDFRGEGGYIIAPPSRRVIEGHDVAYLVETINNGPTQGLDSQRLRDFLDPRPQPKPRPVDVGTEQAVDVERLASWVARRQEGERNHGLFWAACTMAEHNVPAWDALDVLTTAAGHAGLSSREVTTTVRSAYRTVHGPTSAHADAEATARDRPGPAMFSPSRSFSPGGQVPVQRGLA